MKELLKLKDAFYCPLFIYFYHFFCSLYAVRKFDVTFQDENSCYVYLLKMFQVPIIDLEDSFLLRNIRNFTSLAICICCSKPRLERGERIEKKQTKKRKEKERYPYVCSMIWSGIYLVMYHPSFHVCYFLFRLYMH